MAGTGRLALLERGPKDIIAQVRGHPVTAGRFAADVRSLIPKLPDATHCFNLLQDRYAFTVAFTAILAAGKINLLPPNARKAVQARLAESFDGVAVLHDGTEVAPGLDALDLAPVLHGPRDGGGDHLDALIAFGKIDNIDNLF